MMDYPQFITEIIQYTGPSSLGPGKAIELGDSKKSLKKFFSERGNLGFALSCEAGILLRANLLEESHDIANNVHTAEGSYWHGLMHRREPDIHNSDYWFRKVSRHPIFESLRLEAVKISQSYGLDKSFLKQLNSGEWDPFFFNSLCEESRGKKNVTEKFCIDVQEAEWQLLFQYCYEHSQK